MSAPPPPPIPDPLAAPPVPEPAPPAPPERPADAIVGWKFAVLIGDVSRFAWRPSLTLPALGHMSTSGFVLRMLSLDLVLRFGVIWLTLVGTQVLDTTSELENLFEDTSFWFVLFLVAVVAPLLEETSMRLLLHPWSEWRFWVSALIWLAFVGSSVYDGSWGWQGWVLLAWPVGLIVWRGTHRRADAADQWNRHGPRVIWLAVFGFALAHVANYKIPLADWRVVAAVLLVVPQLVGGFCIAYTRVRAGFWAGVAHHSISNAALVIPAGLATGVLG